MFSRYEIVDKMQYEIYIIIIVIIIYIYIIIVISYVIINIFTKKFYYIHAGVNTVAHPSK